MGFFQLFLFLLILVTLISASDSGYSGPDERHLGGTCTVIDSPGTYVLEQDIVRRPDIDTPAGACPSWRTINKTDIQHCVPQTACLTIRAQDVAVDCQGHSIIIGDWIQSGVVITYQSMNVTIKNCNIERPYSGIRVDWGGSHSNTFVNNSIILAINRGYDINGNDSTLDCKGKRITSIFFGIYGYNVHGWTIRNCIMESAEYGMKIYGNRNLIDNNSIADARAVGYSLSGQDNVLSNNLLSQETPLDEGYAYQTGFEISSDNSNISGNAAGGTNGSCFNIMGAGSSFTSNKAEKCDFGFHITGSENELINNEASENRNDGFLIERSSIANASGNVLRNNIARGNGRYGFNLDDSRNTFGANVDEGNPFGSLFNNPLKGFFDGIMLWFREVLGG